MAAAGGPDDRIRVAARVRPLSEQERARGEEVAVRVQDAYTVVTLGAPERDLPAAARREPSTGPTGCTVGVASGCSSAASSSGLFPGVASAGLSLGRDGIEASRWPFDAAFDCPDGVEDTALQAEVFQELGRPLLQDALEGISGCLFAYGISGSGKTFSTLGTEEAPGLLPRLADGLLQAKHEAEEGEELSIRASFLELYNENLIDLLSESREPLRLFEDSREGVLVRGLSEVEVLSQDDFADLFLLASRARTVGATQVNIHSSRSHALLQLRVCRVGLVATTRAKVHVIDLAGSERQKRSRSEGARLREGIHINVSLSALGMVISRLSEIAQGRNHCSVPFRDSKLTFLLKDSLMGSARTQVLIALSPTQSNYEESISSLRFAQSVKRIRTRPVANVTESCPSTASQVQMLRAEVERLQAQLDAQHRACLPTCLSCTGASTGGGAAGALTPTPDRRAAVAEDATAHSAVTGGSGAVEVLHRLAGVYLSPTKRRIEVTRQGEVRFLGGAGHHPIRLCPILDSDGIGTPSFGLPAVRLQSDGDPDYRYILVAEEGDHALVWRHEDAATGALGAQEVRWERMAGPPPERPTQAAGEEVTPTWLTSSPPPASNQPTDARVGRALAAARRAAAASPALARVIHAVSGLAHGLRPPSAVEAVEALVALCADVDDANALLEQDWASSGPTSSPAGTPPSMRRVNDGGAFQPLEVAWCAPDLLSQDAPAVELLFVRAPAVQRPPGPSSSPPRTPANQLWSAPEFPRRLRVLREAVAASAASSDARASPWWPAGGCAERFFACCDCSASAGPSRSRDPSASRGDGLSPAARHSGRWSGTGSRENSLQRSAGLRGHREAPSAPTRSPSPKLQPRQIPSPSPMPAAARTLPPTLPLAPRDDGGQLGLQALCGRYTSTSGGVAQVERDGNVDAAGRILRLSRDGTEWLLIDPADAAYGPLRLVAREPDGKILWEGPHAAVSSDTEVPEGRDDTGSSSPVTWTPLEPALPRPAAAAPNALQRFGAPGTPGVPLFQSSPRRGFSAGSLHSLHSQQAGRRPRSAERDNWRAPAGERHRRSSTPMGAHHGNAHNRAQSAVAGSGGACSSTPSRLRLGVAAGAGDAGLSAKAFDKNSLRLRNGSVFVDAIARWRAAHGNVLGSQSRRHVPGTCAVYVRKRPMFERDVKRCDFDVLSVLGSAQDVPEGMPVGQEIAHHTCMFDRTLVTPLIIHTHFPFDGVFDARASNEEVYRIVARPLLENVLAGNLSTLFMFGQTGSGKTYTMRAIERMAVEELFDKFDGGTEVSLTYFELAGRKALDLLTDPKTEIRLREEEDGCFRPHDCEEALTTNAEELLQVMSEAAQRRATDATTVNSSSSRSHAVCRISVLRGDRRPSGRLLLVDCAGTERSRDTLFFKGQHVKESAEINSSLFALKDCIRFRQAALKAQQGGGLPADGTPLRLPSVRGAPLTKVLAESLLSPSAQLAAIGTVSPNATDAEHTIDTLRTVYTLSGRSEARILESRQVLE